MIVSARLSGLDKVLLALDSKLSKKVINRTINNLMVQGSNAGQRKVRERYNIKSKQLKRYINVRRSNFTALEARLSVRSRDVSLFNFINKSSISSSLKTKRRKGRRPVKVKIIRGGSAHKLNHAFTMIGKSGNIGIFERVPGLKSRTGRDKIRRLNTVGPAKMFEKEGVPIMQDYVNDNTARLFKDNFNYYVGKMK